MQKNEIVIYQSQDGTIKVDVLFEGKTVWLTQSQFVLYLESLNQQLVSI